MSTAAAVLPPGTESAAFNVAGAEAAVARAAEVLADATEKTNRIASRIAILQGERAAIVTRRQRGEGADDDGARLALISADTEWLNGLLSDAERVVADARGPQAQAALAAARHQLSVIEAEAEEAALVNYLGELETRIRDGIERLAGLHARLGRGRPMWAPSTALMLDLRRLASAGGTL